MLRPRIVCSLLMASEDLVKTKNFSDPVYIGDPINTVRIFNEKKVDEIFLMDMDAYKNDQINFDILEKIASISRMPICYGGGIKTKDQIERILSLGIEKVSLNTSLFQEKGLELLNESTNFFGSQSITVCLDIKKNKNEYEIYNKNILPKSNMISFMNKIINCKIGEIIIQSVDQDGNMNGFDIQLLSQISKLTKNIPLTILGGAGSIDDLIKVSKKFNISGYGCGSIFCFKQKRGTVLINYFKNDDKRKVKFLKN